MDAVARHQCRARLLELADDVGRLRRRVKPDDELGAWAVERVACHVEALFGWFDPTAAEIAGVTAPGQEQAITEAIRIVDARYRKLRHRLGLEAAT